MPRLFPGRVGLVVVAAGVLAATSLTPAQAASSDKARFAKWSSTTQLAAGSFNGVKAANGSLVLTKPTQSMSYTDPWGSKRTWSYGTWTSPWRSADFGSKDATRLIPSWTATTGNDTWIRVSARVRSGSKTGSWDVVARWAFTDASIHKTSSTSQPDDRSSVNVDTVTASKGTTFDGYQLKVDLVRKPGTTVSPVVTSLSGIVSNYGTRTATTSKTSMTAAKTLAVPAYSQMVHDGHHPEWDNGGEAWCSPTSTSMVLKYFTSGPTSKDYAWEKGVDGQVDHAARYTYDRRYEGTGNWPFNTAYAGRYGLDSYVTRLYDLREAEQFIKAGIPLVASIAFSKGQLAGSPLTSTPGHLLVIVGFTKNGDVVVNDPAGPKNSSVRRTYKRAQLEKAWLGGSGGVVYVVHPASKKLPTSTARWS